MSTGSGELDLSTEFNCPACGLGVQSGFSFCPRCRAVAEGRDYDPAEADRHERHFVLSLVLLSLGALAIPRLLRSQAFSPGWKAVLAVVGVLYTAICLGILYWFAFAWFPGYVEGLYHQVGR